MTPLDARSEERHLTRRSRLRDRSKDRLRLSSQQQQEIALEPEVRFAVEAVLPLLRVEPAIVPGSQHVMKILVMDDRLNEVAGNGRGVQGRMNADLGGSMVVRPQPYASPLFSVDSLTPADRQRLHVRKIVPPDLRSESFQVVERNLDLQRRYQGLSGHSLLSPSTQNAHVDIVASRDPLKQESSQ